MLYRRLIINGSEYQLAVSQYGTGAPNVKTPGAVGALYMNTSDGSLYKCTGAVDGRYAWRAIEHQAGLTEAQIEALNGMFQVCAFVKEDVSEEYSAFQSAFGITAAKLTGISAVYTGGNVTAGTSVNALSGIVVTAHYSDGSTQTVTGYTLGGTIAEGENSIAATYRGIYVGQKLKIPEE